MKHFLRTLALIAACLPSIILASWSTYPDINTVIKTGSTNQEEQVMVGDGQGGCIVAWRDWSAGSFYDIHIQRIDADGDPLWGPDGKVVCAANEFQGAPQIAGDGHGGALVVWYDNRWSSNDLYAQHIDSTGTARWSLDGRQVCNVSSSKQQHTIISDNAGGAIIAWADSRNGSYNIYAQRLDTVGIYRWAWDGLRVAPRDSSQVRPRLLSDGGNGALMVWEDQITGEYTKSVYAQHLDGAGTRLWDSAGALVCDSVGYESTPSIISDGAGGLLAAWADTRFGSDGDLYIQRLNSAGVRQLAPQGVVACNAPGGQWAPVLLPGLNGRSILVWEDMRDSIHINIYAQRLDSVGNSLWDANGKALYIDTVDVSMYRAADADGHGGAYVAWQKGMESGRQDIYAQHVDSAGALQWSLSGLAVCNAPNTQATPAVTATAGGAIVVWHDERYGQGSVYDLFVQRLPFDAPVANVRNLRTSRDYPTLTEALAEFQTMPGDTVKILKDTTFFESIRIPKGVTLTGDSALPTLSGRGLSRTVVRLDSGAVLSFVRVAGSDSIAILLQNTGAARVEDCVIESCGVANGVPSVLVQWCNAGDVRFTRNTFREINPGQTVPMVFLDNNNNATPVYFTNNVFLGSRYRGVEVTWSTAHFYNNLFIGFNDSSGGCGVHANYNQATLRNNIFMNNYYGVLYSMGGLDEDFNFFFNNGTDNSFGMGPHSRTGLDPLLANAGAGDFHLLYNSPCIDAGAPADTFSVTDPDGGAMDIGPFGGRLADGRGIPPVLDSFRVVNAAGYDTLHWAQSPIVDFKQYMIYRSMAGPEFPATVGTKFDSVMVRSTTSANYFISANIWYYKVSVVSTQDYGGGLALGTGRAPVIDSAVYADNRTSDPEDDTLTLYYNMSINKTAFMAVSPADSYVTYIGGNIVNAQMVSEANDSLVRIDMYMSGARPDSIAPLLGRIVSLTGTRNISTRRIPVAYHSPRLKQATYDDQGTPQTDDDVLTVVLTVPVNDATIDSPSTMDFAVMTGSIVNAYTVSGITDDETLYIHLGAGDSRPDDLGLNLNAIDDYTGQFSSTEMDYVPVQDVSAPYVTTVDPTPHSHDANGNGYYPLSVTFSQPLDTSTVKHANFFMYSAARGLCQFPLEASEWDSFRVFRVQEIPWEEALPAGDLVTCVVTTGIKGRNGKSLTRPYTWSFRVRGNAGADPVGARPFWRMPDSAASISALAWGDINKDGWQDLVVGRYNGKTQVLMNDSGKTLVPGWTAQTAYPTRSIALADINADGWNDLVLGNDGQACVAFNNTSGTLGTTPWWTADSSYATRSIAVADFDGNGGMDLACGNYGEPVCIFPNDGSSLMTTPAWSSAGSYNTTSIATGDINNDGRAELVCGIDGDSTRAFVDTGNGLEDVPLWSGPGGPVTSIALDNPLGGGTLDLLTGFAGQALDYAYNTGSSFSSFWNSDSTYQTRCVAMANLMSEAGELQLITANADQPTTMFDNSEGWQAVWSSDYHGPNRIHSALAAGDMTGDGMLELAVIESINGMEYLAVHYNGNAPTRWDSFDVTQDPASRDTTGPGYVYLDYKLYDVEGDSYSVNQTQYLVAGPLGQWSGMSQVDNGLARSADTGLANTFIWDSRADGAIQSDSVYCQLGFTIWGGESPDFYIEQGPFRVDNRGPVIDSFSISKITDSSVTLRWHVTPDQDFDRYEAWYTQDGSIYRDSSDLQWTDSALASQSAFTTTVTGLARGAEYWFSVMSFDTMGNNYDAGTQWARTNVHVSGVVKDSATSNPLAGVKVWLVRTGDMSAQDSAYSDSNGVFTMRQIGPWQSYFVYYLKSGYAPRWYPDAESLMTAVPFGVNGSDTTVGDMFLPLDPSLVAWYPFNGNANDSSGHGNNGTVNGATLTADRFGANNRAYEFNGTDNFVELPDTMGNYFNEVKGWTISAWFKTLSVAGDRQCIIDFHKNAKVIVYVDSGKVYGYWEGQTYGEKTISTVVNENAFYHVVYTYDNSVGTKLFVNGVLAGSDSTVDLMFRDVDSNRIGMWGGVLGGYYFNGVLDDISIYERTLSLQEIVDTYHAGGWPIPDSLPPHIAQTTYFSRGTAPVSDDSMVVRFSEPISDAGLNFGAGHADSVFGLLGPGCLDSATITTGAMADDSLLVIKFSAADTILSHLRSKLVLKAGAVRDLAANACGAETLGVTTLNVCNVRNVMVYQTIDQAQTAASANDTIMVLDEGVYTEALNITKNLTFLNTGNQRPIVHYDSTTASLYLVRCYAAAAPIRVNFTGFEFNGVNLAGTDTITKVLYAEGGTFKNCKIHGAKGTMIYIIDTYNGTVSPSPLVFDSCEIYDGRGGAINWTKRRTNSRISNCKIYGISGSYAGINASGADTTQIVNNIVSNAGFAGIYTQSGCDLNEIAGNVVFNCTYGITHNVSGNKGVRNRIMFNTVYGCSNTGIRVQDSVAAPDTVIGNIASGCVTDITYLSGAPVADYNCYQTMGTWNQAPHDVRAYPQFADTAAKDLHLTAASPCLDASAVTLAAFDLTGNPRPGPVGTSWDLGAVEEQTVDVDREAPDNDLTLLATAIDTDKVELSWNPGSIDSVDADSVGIWYKTTAFPGGANDSTATLVKRFALNDSVDTVASLTPATTYYFGLVARDSAGNWSDTASAANASIFLMPPATSVLVDLAPDTAVVGAVQTFTYRFMPQNGSILGCKVFNPFGRAITVNEVRLNAVPMNITNVASQPTADDTVTWFYDATDTLWIFPHQDYLKGGDTLAVDFTDTVQTLPGMVTINSIWGHQFVTGMFACSTATGVEWNVTVASGPVDSYTLTADTLARIVGTAFACTLTARDQYGNLCTNYDTAGITFTWSGPGNSPNFTAPVYPADQTVKDSLVNKGAAVLPITLYNAEACNLVFTDLLHGLTDTLAVTVQPGAIAALALDSSSVTMTADDTLILGATALDAHANAWDVTDTATGTVWSDNDVVADIVNGVYAPVITDTVKLAATNGGATDTCVVIVLHGAATGINVVPPAAMVTADSILQVSITATDRNGNLWDATAAAVWTATGSASTVDSGRYTADTAGVFNVVADYGGQTDTCIVTVSHGAIAGLVVTPASANVTADSTLTLTATAQDASGNTWLVTDSVATSWSGTGSAISIINGSYLADTIGTHNVIANNSGFTDTCVVTVTRGAIAGLVVTPVSAYVTADSTLALTATVHDVSGNIWVVTDSAATSWSGTGSAAAVVNGMYQADTVGTYNVIATNSGFTDTCVVTVTRGAIAGLAVTPASASVTADSTLMLTAMANDASGNIWPVTDSVATSWSGTGSVAAIVNGSYQADTAGTWNVIATNNGFIDTCVVTVAHGMLVSLDIDSSVVTMTADGMLNLAAMGNDADGNAWDVTMDSSTIWSDNDPSADVMNGVYTPVMVGMYTLSAAHGAGLDSCEVVVTHGMITGLVLTPALANVTADSTLLLTAMANDARGNVWSVTDSVATIWSGTGSLMPVTNGSYHADTIGTHQVIATNSGFMDTCVVTVTPGVLVSLDIDSTAVTMTADGSLNLTAAAYDASGNTWNVTGDTTGTVWSDDDPYADVANGAYNPLRPGTYTLRAANGAGADSCAVTVLHGAAMAVSVLPASVNTDADSVLHLTAQAGDADGNTWDVTTDTLTAWSGPGSMTAVFGGVYYVDTMGVHLVTAAYAGYLDTCVVTAAHGVPTGISITPTSPILTADDTLAFTATAHDTDGNLWDVTDIAAWSGEGSRSVVINGAYHADTAGAWRVFSDFGGGLRDSVGVIVQHGVLVSLDVDSSAVIMTTDDTLRLTAMAYDADNNPWNVTTDTVGGPLWSDNDGAADVTDGIYVPVSPGAYNIYVMRGPGADSCAVTVQHGAATSLSLAPASTTLSADSTLQLTVTAFDAKGASWTVTGDSAVTWQADGSAQPVVNGLYTADTAGTFNVIVAYLGFADTCVATVTSGALARLAIDGDSVVALTTDTTRDFTMRGYDADNNAVPLSTPLWTYTGGSSGSLSSLNTAATTLIPAQPGTGALVAADGIFNDTVQVTILAGVPAYVQITPASATITADSIAQFTAMAYDAKNNSLGDVTFDTATVWTGTGITGTPDSGRYRAESAGVETVIVVYDGFADTAIVTVTHGLLAGLSLALSRDTIAAGDTVICTVFGHDADNNLWDTTAGASLAAAPNTGIMVFNGNRVTATLARDFTISAQVEVFNATRVLTVLPNEPGIITFIQPVVDSVTDSIESGDSLQYMVTVTDQYNNPVADTTQVLFGWYDEGGGNVGGGERLNPATVRTVGGQAQTWFIPSVNFWDNYRITASVLQRPGVVDTSDAVVVLPTELVYVRIVYGGTQIAVLDTTITTDQDSLTFRVAGYDALMNFLGYVTAQWNLVGDTIGFISSANDTNMRLIATRPNAASVVVTIRDTVRGITYSDTTGLINVVPGKVASVTVAPDPAVVSVNDTLRFTAVGRDADSNMTTEPFAWTVKPVSIGAIDAQGLFQGLAVGTGWVIVTSGTVSDTAHVTVQALLSEVRITQDSITISADSQAVLTAVGYNTVGSPVPCVITWSVSDTAIGTVDTAGVFTPVITGTVWVTARSGGFADSVKIMVQPGAIASLVLTPEDTTVSAAGLVQYVAKGYDAKGNERTDTYAWSVSSTQLGAINAVGLFDARGAGTGWIKVSAGAAIDSGRVTVIDDIAPVCNNLVVTISGAAVRIAAAGSDTGAGTAGTPAESLYYLYKLDDDTTWDTASIRQVFVNLTDGQHRIKVCAMDAAGNTDTLHPVSDSFTVSLGTQAMVAGQWGMVSIPKNVHGQKIDQLAQSDSGAGVRLYQWDESAEYDPFTLKYVSRAESALGLGQGYWLSGDQGFTLEFDSTAAFVTTPQTIALRAGWNQIGNAYSYGVNWSRSIIIAQGRSFTLDSAAAAGIIEDGLYGYSWTGDTAGYVLVRIADSAALAPWTGYWIKANEACRLVESMDPYFGPDALPISKTMAFSADNWELKLALRCGTGKDEYNYIGVNRAALAGSDRFDLSEPPVMGRAASLSFANGLCADYRAGAEVEEWDITVRADAGQAAVITWSNAGLPATLKLYLFDLASGTVVSLQGATEYRFTGGERHFKLVAATLPAYRPATLTARLSVQSAPNPFKEFTRVSFTVPFANAAQSAVSVAVYDVTGRLVRTLASGNFAPGTYECAWDGRAFDGKKVLPGQYCVRMSAGEQSAAQRLEVVR
jgi:hypothetical protein